MEVEEGPKDVQKKENPMRKTAKKTNFITVEGNKEEEDTETIDDKDYDLEMEITAKEAQKMDLDESDSQMDNDEEINLTKKRI